MPRITVANSEVEATLSTLAEIKAKLDMVPNLFKTFAHSPAALQANLTFGDALAKGVLTARQREIVALATAQVNRCHYCLAAHTLLGKAAGLSDAGVLDARRGTAESVTDNAIAELARAIAETRGHVDDEDLSAARAAQLSDAQIIEVVANVAHNVLTNFTNNLAHTAVDFPQVPLDLPV